ncbi:MAG: T9SS type A sorting domain-containing protein, partial [bacterium]|nr:T9SS type A sorting domain-containing protein [bacterium]
GLTNPQLYVDIKHQLHNSDYFRVEYSLNGGATWTALGSTEPNWYNSNGYWRNSISNPVDQWTKVQKSLCALAGQPCVKFRFRGRPYYSEPTYTGHHYFAFDNVEIKDGPDVGIVAYQDPVDVGCSFSANQIVTVDVYNFGCTPISNVPVVCDITGPVTTTLTGTVPGPIAPGTSVSYTFSGTFDMSTVGTYNFVSYTNLAGDIYLPNDTLGTSILVDQLLVNTYPYLEDFNSGNAYWIASGSAPPLNGGRNFVLGNIPYLNGPQGEGDSWYVETTSSNNGSWVWVESPVFDFSNLTNPTLTMDIKHQLHNSDYFQVQYSINGGATWVQLGSGPDPLWYNGNNYWRNSISTPQDAWLTVEQELCELSGEPCVKFRVRGRPYYSEPTYTGHHYFGFDNFAIDAGEPDDIRPLEITLADAGDCSTYGVETMSVVIENMTCRPLYNVPVDIQVNGGPVTTEIMPGPIPAFGFYIYTFTNTFDLSTVGTHTISVTTNLATDANPANDNIVEVRYSGAPVATFPYTEDFNTDNGGWVSRTTSDTRLFHLDTLPYLNGPQGEGDSWYVKTSASNDGAWIDVESPVFDFSGLTNPQLYVDIKHQLHNSDYFRVEYSLNGGATWTALGSTEPNWYNSNGYWRNSISNPVDQWTKVQKSLCALAGQPCVKFRFRGRPYYSEPTYTGHHYFAFDNFEILEGGDVGVVAFVEPVDQGCLYSTTQNVTVEVFNFSCQPESNVPISCDITGALNTTLTGTVPGPIPANGSVNFTFPTTIDMTTIGTYNFVSYTQLPTDIKNDNDTSTLVIDVNQVTINTFPYEEDFNAGNGYWLASGSAPPLNGGRNFVLGNLPYLNGPQGQGDSWYVETTASNNGSWVWVESPVFDLSTLTNPTLEFDIKHQLHNSDYFQVQYSINGGVTWIQLGNGPDPEWYNGTNYWRNSISNPVDEWQRVRMALCNLVGESCVKFRMRGRPYYSEPTYTGHHYFAFDNVRITDTDIDAELTLIDGCYGSEYFMEITVFNNNKLCQTSDTITSIDITYTIDGGAPVTQTFTGLSIPYGQGQTISIPNVTIPSSGSVITAWCALPNGVVDQITWNDTMTTTAATWQNCNDYCSNATQLGIGSTTISQTSNATTSPGIDPLFPCGNPTLENTVWYFFQTDSTGGQVELQITNTTCTPSSNGIQVSINQITGAPCDTANYTNVYCANQGNTNDLIWGPVTLPPNTLYYITIDGYAGNDCDFDITLLGSVDPLPVELSQFNALCQGDETVLSWTTESEHNNDYFVVERSGDAQVFETIDVVSGQGTSTQSHQYVVVDNAPRNGVVYYRLKQVDFNGEYEYSDLIAVDCGVSGNWAELYPNPSTGNSHLIVHAGIAKQGDLTITDQTGKLLFEKTLKAQDFNSEIALNGTQFEPGIYYVTVTTEEQQFVQKWIITQH